MKSKLFLFEISLLYWLAVIPIFGHANVNYNHKKDIVYGYKDGMALVMDIYSPKVEFNRAGIIVVIAGGMSSNPVDSHNVGNRYDIQKLLKEGYVVFATTHSSQPKFTADEIRYDIPRAVRFIRFNATKFGIDKHRLGIIGYSSGGHVSLMAGLSTPLTNNSSNDPIEMVSSELQAVVAYYPSTDLLNFGNKNKSIIEHFHSVGYMLDAAFDFHTWDTVSNRFERISNPDIQKKYFKKNSPVSYVTKEDPPIMLIHGDQDKLVPIQQSELLAAELEKMGVPNKFLIVENKGHGFNFRDSEGNEFEEVLDWFEKYLLLK